MAVMKPYDFFSRCYQQYVKGNYVIQPNDVSHHATSENAFFSTPKNLRKINVPQIQVTHFHRHQNKYMWSIEKVFNEVRRNLPDIIKVTVYEATWKSKGVMPRIRNIMEARKERSLINHVTGDIHYVTLGLPRKSTLLTIHDLGFMNQYRGVRRLILWLFWIYLPVIWVKKVVAISNATKTQILRYTKCNPDKIEVISNFLPAYFIASPKEFNQQKPVILQIGTKFNKNIERLAEALHGLMCELLIIGELNEEHLNLLNKHQIEFENRVNLTEEGIVEAYRECDLVSFCSLLEGFGLPILEAQATGRPVVTSNIYSMPEVAGNAACLVDPYDVKSIRNGIEKVIFDQEYRELLISRGYENSKKYTVESVARQYTDIYCELYVNLI